MNSKVIYGLVFLMAFVLTTAGIIFMNNKYNNIFKMDFSPPGLADSLKARADSLRMADSLRVADSLKNANLPDSLKIQLDSTNHTAEVHENAATSATSGTIEKAPAEKSTAESKPMQQENKQIPAAKAKAEAEYNDWVKNTAALYDLMDAKKAAKIIQKHSDNEARDILYAMKKKKAAEILSELSPEVAQRFIRKN